MTIIALFALVGLIVLFPLIVILAAGLFWWIIAMLLQTATVTIKAVRS